MQTLMYHTGRGNYDLDDIVKWLITKGFNVKVFNGESGAIIEAEKPDA